MADLWDKRDSETMVAYEAFEAYLGLGPTRSQEKVAKVLSKSRQLMARWSADHEWVSRVEAYDLVQIRGERERIEREESTQRRKIREIRRASYAKSLRLAYDQMTPEKAQAASFESLARVADSASRGLRAEWDEEPVQRIDMNVAQTVPTEDQIEEARRRQVEMARKSGLIPDEESDA